MCVLFFFNDTATTEIYTLSLHDALPISTANACRNHVAHGTSRSKCRPTRGDGRDRGPFGPHDRHRSEEHTSELQSRLHLVCRLLLEKKNYTRREGSDAARSDTASTYLHY